MPRKTPPGGSIRVSQESIERIRRIAKKTGLHHIEIMGTLLDMCEQHNLLKKDWQKRLNVSLERGRREIEESDFDTDPNRCVAIAKGEEKFKCVWGRKGKPPMIRLLAKEYSLSKEMCFSCVKTLLLITENEDYIEKIRLLEFQLQAKSDMMLKVPVCEAVGVLNGDGTLFSRCQEHNMRAVNIEKFCKVKDNGEPCSWYKESIVGVAARI